jgi:hypothetical protein
MYANKKMNVIISCAGIVLFAIIITALSASIVLESGIINVSYAQVLQRLPSTGSEVTTPGANPMCDPTDRNVNTTESHVCGIPKTPAATGAAESTTTEPSGSTTTSPPPPPSGTQESPIPGLPGLQ